MSTTTSRSSIRLSRPGTLQARVRPPGSKSISNRALLIAALADGRSRLSGMLEAEDTEVMRACLRRLGVEVAIDDEVWTVDGRGEALGTQDPGPEPLFVGTAGTAARFLTAVLAATHADAPHAITVDGTPRMRERPMALLLDALREQGARIECTGEDGFLPITIRPCPTRLAGGQMVLPRPRSSQFVSALALSAVRASATTIVALPEGTPARPYVDMTLRVLEQFGGAARWRDEAHLEIEPCALGPRDYVIEPDASGASYFLALAAIHGGEVLVPDMGSESLQGDAGFFRVLERMGARAEQGSEHTKVRGGTLRGAQLDLSDMPDMTLTAAVTALFADGPTTITGVGILRHHESDRIAAGATELRKLGAKVEEREDGLHIEPPAGGPTSGVAIDTYDDHRMAMAFSLVGDVVINEPGCVAKTYPRYFDELTRLGMVVDDA